VEAPTTGSVVLASLLLKMGGYGLIRFLIFFLAHGTVYFLPIVYMLLLISIVYASFTTLIQIDIKRIIAYSSVAHMNFALLGLFALTEYGITGSILIMISHGLISGALFFLIGMVYERFHSRLIFYYSGLSQRLPLFTFYFLFFIFSNMSLPGCASFAGEFLTIIGLCQKNLYLGILSLIGVFLCTAYSV
jgi:NADH:ubiquinone oxidoreductase subunit 4 (subunit M)